MHAISITNPTTPIDPDGNSQSGSEIVPAEQQLAHNTGNNVRASWNFSLHDVRANMHHCSVDRKKLLIDSFLWSIDPRHPVTLSEFAAAVGYDKTTVARIYQGKYTGPDGKRLDVPEKMAKGAREFLARQKKRFQGREEFVLTPTAQRIWTVLDLARESKTVSYIIGPSHIGKTWALENYAVNNNHGGTPYIRMKAASGLGGMVKRIASQVGVSDKGNTAQLIDYIKRAISPEMLLIFDELHLLMYTYRIGSFFACLEVIREIHDETGAGIALCGTQLLMEKIKGGQHTEMEQLVRRGVHKLILPSMPTKGDLEKILHRNGLDFPTKRAEVVVQGFTEKPYDLLKQLARVEGLLAITERIRYAHKLADKREEEISWDHFVSADLLIKSNAQPEASWE